MMGSNSAVQLPPDLDVAILAHAGSTLGSDTTADGTWLLVLWSRVYLDLNPSIPDSFAFYPVDNPGYLAWPKAL